MNNTINENIVVLSDKDKARKKINVWHGSSSNWINMIKELSGNSLDIFEKLNTNEINTINIKLHNNNKIEYIDSGLGIPVEKIASDGKPNYKAIFEVPFAGSNYGNEVATVGTNGVFLYTLAMTCEDIEFFIARPDGNIYNIAYHKGDRVKDLNIIGKSDKTYTKIIFSLDKEVWDNPNFTFEEIKNIVRGQASLSNVEIILEDIENNLKEVFRYENGIIDYFNELTNNKNFINENILRNTKSFTDTIKFKNETLNEDFFIDFAFKYSNDSNEDIQKDFLNTADLILHGTIQEGIINGFKNSIHKYKKVRYKGVICDRCGEDNGKYDKNEKNISLDDASQGLNYICNVKNKLAEYQNQTKQRTEDKYYKPVLQKFIENFLELYFLENKKEAELICNQVLINSRVRQKSDVARKNARKILEEKADSITTRPNKFVPCRSKIPSEINYIIIEGDGAMNSIKLARNPATMCIQPLKGKPINPFKCKLDELLNNTEVLSMYKVWGCGIEYNGKPVKGMPKYNYDNLQVNDILAYTDFDWDGWHIQCLLIGIVYRLSPDLLRKGKLHIGITPLYVIRTKKEVEWKGEKTKELLAYSENEFAEIVKYLKSKNIKFKETRFKGLGGLPVNIMAKSLDPKTRILKQITLEDVEKSKELLELFLSDEGDNQQKRKEFIEKYSKDYFDYSLFMD